MSLTYEKLPEEPLLRTWEVNETHSRFEYYQAVPSDEALHIQFIILATINSLVAVTTCIVICSILSSKELRINPFNWYLVFIFLPDFIMSSLCIFGCAFSATLSKFYSEWMCSFQSMYLVFGLCANCWMNVFIVYEVHKLLRFSYLRRRYLPPKRSTIGKQAFGVYLYAIAWGLVGIFPIDWLPHHTYAWYGFFCFPQEYDRASTIFYWLVFIPAIMGIPILYISYVCYDTWKRQLLPPQGRRRNLSIYFVRLILVYFIMWTPAILIRIVCNFWDAGAWVSWVGAVWCHLQGIASACVAMTKPDLRQAVVRFCGLSRYFKETCRETSTKTSRRTSLVNGRRSLGISLMESFNRGSVRSFLKKFASARNAGEGRPGDDQDSYEEDDLFCDADLTESAAMRAITPVVLSLTEPSETLNNEEVYLSGFEDQEEYHFRGDEGDGSPPIIMEIDEEKGCLPESNISRRIVSFSHPKEELHSGFDNERRPDNGDEDIVPNVPRSSEKGVSSETNEQQLERLASSSGNLSDPSDHPAVPDEEQVAEGPYVEED